MTNQEFIESIALEGEEWRDVVGYEGYYMVSSFGRMVSCSRTVRRFGRIHIFKEPALLSDVSNTTRYNRVVLKVDGQKKSCDVHRLVAEAFIPNTHKLPQVDHIDGNRANNNINNLRWCTCLENQNNPITRKKHRERLTQAGSRFAPKAVVSFNAEGIVGQYQTMCEAAKSGYNQAMISECCSGRRKHHRGLCWMYLSDYETQSVMSKNSNIPKDN